MVIVDGRRIVEVRFDCHHDQGMCDGSCRLSARQLVLRQWREDLAATAAAIDEERIARLRARHAQLEQNIHSLEGSAAEVEFAPYLRCDVIDGRARCWLKPGHAGECVMRVESWGQP